MCKWLPSARHAAAASLFALLALATQHCKACTVYDLTSAGFAANLWHLLPALGLLADNGTFFVNSERFRYSCSQDSGLVELFNTSALVAWTPKAEARAPDAPCRRLNPFLTQDVVSGADISADAYDDLIELSLPEVWRLQAPLQAEVDKNVRHLSDLDPPTIGFHVRGGDKLQEDVNGNRPSTTAQDYVRAFQENYPDVTGGTCVVVGDDHALMAETGALARKAIGCRLFAARPFDRPSPSGHLQHDFNESPVRSRCAATHHLMADIELLAHTDFFVGTLNSGLPHLIDKLRYVLYGKHRRTFVDASYERRDWYQRVRAYLARPHGDFAYDDNWRRLLL